MTAADDVNLPRAEAEATHAAMAEAVELQRESHQREHELHDIRHEAEHTYHTREHAHDAESLTASHLALKEELRGTQESHRLAHKDEGDALALALAAEARMRDFHEAAHNKEHDAHQRVHEKEQMAVATALASVGNERAIHAAAHEREHLGHAQVHDLAQLAVGKAEVSVEERLRGMNEFRGQLRDQQASFATRDSVDVLRKEIDRRFEENTKLTQDRYEANRSAIATLKETDIKGEGRSLGQGATVAAIIASVGFIATLLGLLILAANFFSGTVT